MKRLLECTSLLFVAATVVACDRSESMFDPEAAAFASAPGYMDGWSSSNPNTLKPLLEREKARIEMEEERNRRIEDELEDDDDYESGDDYPSDSIFLTCRVSRYEAETKIIGPEGGSLRMGRHELRIPKGALSKYTVVTGEAPTSRHVDVKLSPHGLQFLKTPMLTLSYEDCDQSHSLPYQMGYVSGDTVLEWPPCVDSKEQRAVIGWIRHFSIYRIMRGYTPAGARPLPRQLPAVLSVGRESPSLR